MAEYLQVWRAQVSDEAVELLLQIRPPAIAEAQQLCPELISAELVRVGNGTWLDVLRWTVPDGEERLLRHADRFDALHKMHSLLDDAALVGRGEIVTGG